MHARSASWTLAIFLLLAGCADDSKPVDPALIDSDGDGFTDANETAAGSDPHNGTSVPQVRATQDVTFTDVGLIVAGTEDPTGAGCGAFVPQGTAIFTWTIEAPAEATSAHVASIVVTATYPPTMPEGDIYVFSPTGDVLTESTPAAIPPAADDRVTAEGKFPTGPFRIEVRGCVGAGEVEVNAVATVSFLAPAEAVSVDF